MVVIAKYITTNFWCKTEASLSSEVFQNNVALVCSGYLISEVQERVFSGYILGNKVTVK